MKRRKVDSKCLTKYNRFVKEAMKSKNIKVFPNRKKFGHIGKLWRMYGKNWVG